MKGTWDKSSHNGLGLRLLSLFLILPLHVYGERREKVGHSTLKKKKEGN